MALIGLGVAIDYALLMIFRFREELQHGDREQALVTTMRHAGRSVIVSGSTVAIGLLEPDHPAAAVHPLDRDRRDADPGGLGDRRDHAAAGAALHRWARGSTACGCCPSGCSWATPTPSAASGGAGPHRRAPALAGRARRHRHRRVPGVLRPADEPGRRPGQGPPGQRRRPHRLRHAHRRRDQPRRAQAVPDRGRGVGRPRSSSRRCADEIDGVEGIAGAVRAADRARRRARAGGGLLGLRRIGRGDATTSSTASRTTSCPPRRRASRATPRSRSAAARPRSASSSTRSTGRSRTSSASWSS